MFFNCLWVLALNPPGLQVGFQGAFAYHKSKKQAVITPNYKDINKNVNL